MMSSTMKKILLAGGVAVVGFVVYKKMKGGRAPVAVASSSRDQIIAALASAPVTRLRSGMGIEEDLGVSEDLGSLGGGGW